MFRIHVVHNGRGVDGARVHVSWRYRGGHLKGRTDRNGYINFNASGGEGSISVEGKEVFKGAIRDGDIIEVPRIY